MAILTMATLTMATLTMATLTMATLTMATLTMVARCLHHGAPRAVDRHAGHPLGGEDVLGRELRHHRGHGELGVPARGSAEG